MPKHVNKFKIFLERSGTYLDRPLVSVTELHHPGCSHCNRLKRRECLPSRQSDHPVGLQREHHAGSYPAYSGQADDAIEVFKPSLDETAEGNLAGFLMRDSPFIVPLLRRAHEKKMQRDAGPAPCSRHLAELASLAIVILAG